jgi:hypothetical protein
VTFGIFMTFLTTPLQQQIQQYAFAQDDESETDREQRLKQKNVGSGDSTNFYCVANTFDGIPSSLSFCQTGEDAQLSVTKTLNCNFGGDSFPSGVAVCDFALASDNFPDPSDYQITVTGNNPDPSRFAGSESPVVVSIGPGEYTVSETLADTSALQQELDASFIDTRSVFTGDCINSFGGTTSTTGTIAAEESQECNIGNEITIFDGTVPQD